MFKMRDHSFDICWHSGNLCFMYLFNLISMLGFISLLFTFVPLVIVCSVHFIYILNSSQVLSLCCSFPCCQLCQQAYSSLQLMALLDFSIFLLLVVFSDSLISVFLVVLACSLFQPQELSACLLYFVKHALALLYLFSEGFAETESWGKPQEHSSAS